jgi:hypothetical protein
MTVRRSLASDAISEAKTRVDIMNGKELIEVFDRLSREKGIDKARIIGAESFKEDGVRACANERGIES